MSTEIMIVIEDRELGTYLQLSLLSTGANVHLSTSASEAMEMLKAPRKMPRLLLVSSALTDVPIIKFLEDLCHEERLNQSEVILLSSRPTNTQLEVQKRKFLVLDKVGDLDVLIEAARFYIH